MNYGVGRYWLATGLYRKWAAAILAGAPDKARPLFVEASALHPNPLEIAQSAVHCPPLRAIEEALRRAQNKPPLDARANRFMPMPTVSAVQPLGL